MHRSNQLYWLFLCDRFYRADKHPEKEPAGKGVPEGLKAIRGAMSSRHRSKRTLVKVPNWLLTTHAVMPPRIMEEPGQVWTLRTQNWSSVGKGRPDQSLTHHPGLCQY